MRGPQALLEDLLDRLRADEWKIVEASDLLLDRGLLTSKIVCERLGEIARPEFHYAAGVSKITGKDHFWVTDYPNGRWRSPSLSAYSRYLAAKLDLVEVLGDRQDET